MDFCHMNPFVRFAEVIHFESPGFLRYVQDCRVFYILSGSGRIVIDEQEYELVPHSVFYCCSGSRYKIISAGMDLIALNFDLTQERNLELGPFPPIMVRQGIDLPMVPDCTVDGYEVLNRHLFLSNGVECHPTVQSIVEEFSSYRPLCREASGTLLKTMLVCLVRQNAEFTTQATRAVRKITAYIAENYHLPLSNEFFAEMTGYHSYYLNRLFMKHIGCTIHRYILNVRIAQAKKLLLNSDIPLAAIAEQTGFNSGTYFSSCFKQMVEMPPLEFRNRFKNSI